MLNSRLGDQQVASPTYSLFRRQTRSFVSTKASSLSLFSLAPLSLRPDKYNTCKYSYYLSLGYVKVCPVYVKNDVWINNKYTF